MMRIGYVVTVDWPKERLTNLGQLTDFLTCGGLDHVGLFIPCCTEDEIAQHSEPSISHESARDEQHVSLDFSKQKIPIFQGIHHKEFFSDDAEIKCYPIRNVNASDLHKLAIMVAQRAPVNHWWLRLNRLLCCGMWPRALCCQADGQIAPSHCAALTLRIIAAGRAGNDTPLFDDAAVASALGVQRGCCFPSSLTGLTPNEVMRLLKRTGSIGPAVSIKQAIADCGKLN